MVLAAEPPLHRRIVRSPNLSTSCVILGIYERHLTLWQRLLLQKTIVYLDVCVDNGVSNTQEIKHLRILFLDRLIFFAC